MRVGLGGKVAEEARGFLLISNAELSEVADLQQLN